MTDEREVDVDTHTLIQLANMVCDEWEDYVIALVESSHRAARRRKRMERLSVTARRMLREGDHV